MEERSVWLTRREKRTNALEVRKRAVDVSGGELLGRIMGQSSIGSAGGNVLVRQTHKVLVLLPELGESGGSFVLGDAVSLRELGLQPREEPNLDMMCKDPF